MGLPRDLIDIHAASRLCSYTELESLGRRHAWDQEFSLSELRERLDGAEWYDDQAFAEYGLSAEEITGLRIWALAWADDIRRRYKRRDLRRRRRGRTALTGLPAQSSSGLR
jgi:hypothetical protein